MDQKHTAKVEAVGKNRSGAASCLLAMLGFVAIFGPDIRFSHIIWSFAILFSVSSLLLAGGRPRRKRWFEQGAIGIVLAVLGLIIMFNSTYPPAFQTTMPPMNYAGIPLPEILHDFCRRAHDQGHHVSFELHGKELTVQKVTFRTRRRMRLKKALRRLTEGAGCSFGYSICAYGSVIIRGHIRIFREKEFLQFGDGRLIIDDLGMRPEGLWREDWEGEIEGMEKRADEKSKPVSPMNGRTSP